MMELVLEEGKCLIVLIVLYHIQFAAVADIFMPENNIQF